MDKSNKIKTLNVLNEKPKLFIFNADLIAPFGIICIIVFMFFYVILSLSLTLVGSIAIWLCATWWILAGTKSYEFTNRFFSLPGSGYYNLNSLFVPATDVGSFKRKMTTRLTPENVKTLDGKTHKIYPFQIESNLHAIMEIDIDGDSFAVLLKYDKEQWSATIPFKIDGVHTQLSDLDAYNYVNGFQDLIKDIPFGESVTFQLGCRSNTRYRSKVLDELSCQNQLPLIDLFIESEKLRIEEITRKGYRQHWNQLVFVTWTQNQHETQKENDYFSRFMNFTSKKLNSKSTIFSNTKNYANKDLYAQIGNDIYYTAYNTWKTSLEIKGKLNPQPLTAQEIWEDLLWHKFNTGDPPEIPLLIKVKKEGREINSELKVFTNNINPKDTLSVLLEKSHSCPQHHKRKDIVSLNGELIATMVLDKSPESWDNFEDQISWVWNKLSDSNIRDTEIYVELNTASKNVVEDHLIRISKQSITSNVHAVKDGKGLDVGATLVQSQATEGLSRLHSGASFVYVAVTILVYRNNIEELSRACQRLSNHFSPAVLNRDRQTSLRLWSETLPINNAKQILSTKIFTERRLKMDSITAPALLPLQKPKKLHSTGLELVTAKGGYPIYIDLFKNNERAIIAGMSGSGKSLLAFGFIKQALALGIKVVGMDLSNAGDSTFKLVTELLGDQGAYIDITEQCFNVMQPPDVTRYSQKITEKRLKIWQNTLSTVLIALSMGQIKDFELEEQISSVITSLLDVFFRDENIMDRYNKAFAYGWQSKYWKNMPTIKDLLFFCSEEKLNMKGYSRAIAQINNQISAKIVDPNIGQLISQPSNLPPLPELTFFGLSGLTNENNSYIMALIANMTCLNISLESPESFFVVDECSVLLPKKGFAQVIGERCATGRKEGQSVLLIGQDIEAINNCSAKSQILTNTDYKFIGRITNDVIDTYTNEVKIPLREIQPNASESFQTNKHEYFSNWLVTKNDNCWPCRYFPSYMEYSALANSPKEQKRRNEIMEKYPNDNLGKIKAISHFARNTINKNQ